MYSIVKDIKIFEESLNDNPNPILLIDLTTYDLLYWNDSYKEFLNKFFDIDAEKIHNINDMTTEIKNMFYFLIEQLKDKKIYTIESELKSRNIKTQIIKSLSYFVVFIDVTSTKKMLSAYKEKSEILENTKKNNTELIKKNIKLWSIISSKIIQFIFVIIVFLSITTTLVKDYYLGRYEEKERKFEQFMKEQSEIKIQMLETITVISENNKKALEILIQRENNIYEVLKKITKDIDKNQKKSEELIKKYGLNIETIE